MLHSRNASKRLLRTVIKKHPKLEKKLPPRPELAKDQPDAEKVMLLQEAKNLDIADRWYFTLM